MHAGSVADHSRQGTEIASENFAVFISFMNFIDRR